MTRLTAPAEPDALPTLQRTVADAACPLDDAVYASVSLVLQRQVETPGHTDERALWTDQLQYEPDPGRAWTRSGSKNTARPS